MIVFGIVVLLLIVLQSVTIMSMRKDIDRLHGDVIYLKSQHQTEMRSKVYGEHVSISAITSHQPQPWMPREVNS